MDNVRLNDLIPKAAELLVTNFFGFDLTIDSQEILCSLRTFRDHPFVGWDIAPSLKGPLLSQLCGSFSDQNRIGSGFFVARCVRQLPVFPRPEVCLGFWPHSEIYPNTCIFPPPKTELYLLALLKLPERHIQDGDNAEICRKRVIERIYTLLIYIPHPVMFGWSNQEEYMGGACSTYGGWGELYTGFCWGNLRERGHLEDPSVNGMIKIKISLQEVEYGEMDLVKLAQGRDKVVGTCECSNESSGCLKCGKLLD